MVTNDQEYRVTGERIDGLTKALAEIEAGSATLDPHALECQRNAHHRLIGDLRNQLKEYDELCSGAVTQIRALTLDDLPRALVKARLARRLSVEQLAQRLGWKASLLARYEETEYESAKWPQLVSVADALSVRVESGITFEDSRHIPSTEELLAAFVPQHA